MRRSRFQRLMAQPRMVIIAGPPGAGKSSLFALSDFAKNVFNADDRAAVLNAGSYQSIPLSVRAIVNRELSRLVLPSRWKRHCGAPSLSNKQDSPARTGFACSCATLPWTRWSITLSE